MRKVSVLFLLSVFALVSVTAQDVQEIIGNYYKSLGGVEVWKDLKSWKMSGTSNLNGMEFPITIYNKRPNLEKVEIEVQGMQIVQAYDGSTAWGINPFQGDTEATKADDDTNKEAAKKRFEDELIDYQEKGHSLELLGNEEIEGADTYKIKLTKKDGDEMIYFFDQENYVPIMIRSFAGAGPMKGSAIETYLSDYEEVEGLIMPMSLEQRVNGQTFLQGTMKEVMLNAEIDDAIFTFPGEEKDMAEKEVEKEKEVTEEMVEKAVEKKEMAKEELKKEMEEASDEAQMVTESMDKKKKKTKKEKKKKKNKEAKK